jgi:acyl-CoA reductase-like NAD-dependent aldehyde dehydrogenase
MNTDWLRRAQELPLQIRNVVDGPAKPTAGKTLIDKYSPRDGRLLYQYFSADASAVDAAVGTARRAFEDGRWSRVAASRRKDVLLKLSSLIEARRDEFALRECLDVGKPISDALKFDVPGAAAYMRFCAEAIDKLAGKVYSVDQSSLSYELRRPVGVVAGIVGWNFPLYLAVQKIAPVLATGNSLVLKPSEVTSLSAWRLAELALEAGLPQGVFNVIHGDLNVGAALAYHQDVDLLTFTGSSKTGKELLIASGRSNMKRLILECGGKAPSIVFDDGPDLDLDAIAQAVVGSAFLNQGQVCVASSRLLVHESIKEKLLESLAGKVAAITVGDPLSDETKYGPLVSQSHKQRVQGYIETGIREGARLVCQAPLVSPDPGGFYLAATVFDGVSAGHRIALEEIFGPVLSVISFRDEAQAIEIANGTPYGLSAVLWTRDVARAHRMTQAIKAGWVVVNATERPSGGPGDGVLPVGGQKESGLGAEGGVEGLEAYLSRTTAQVFI